VRQQTSSTVRLYSDAYGVRILTPMGSSPGHDEGGPVQRPVVASLCRTRASATPGRLASHASASPASGHETSVRRRRLPHIRASGARGNLSCHAPTSRALRNETSVRCREPPNASGRLPGAALAWLRSPDGPGRRRLPSPLRDGVGGKGAVGATPRPTPPPSLDPLRRSSPQGEGALFLASAATQSPRDIAPARGRLLRCARNATERAALEAPQSNANVTQDCIPAMRREAPGVYQSLTSQRHTMPPCRSS